jgi:hypothetical protein
MARKKGKSVSFNAMVKFFMQTYNIPTKKDVDKLIARMDRLEKYIKMTVGSARNRRLVGKAAVNQKEPKGRVTMSASDTVLDIVKRYNKGIGFAEIQAKTGFEEKKLRNIIFRLNKMGKISRKSRGIYIVD